MKPERRRYWDISPYEPSFQGEQWALPVMPQVGSTTCKGNQQQSHLKTSGSWGIGWKWMDGKASFATFQYISWRFTMIHQVKRLMTQQPTHFPPRMPSHGPKGHRHRDAACQQCCGQKTRLATDLGAADSRKLVDSKPVDDQARNWREWIIQRCLTLFTPSLALF